LEDNTARFGGAIYVGSGDFEFTDLTFFNNHATDFGGAICYGSSYQHVFKRCLITGNTAVHGGAIAFTSYWQPIIINCTITGNSADNGGAFWSEASSPLLFNSIVCGNEPEQIYIAEGMYPYATMFISHSILEGGVEAIYNSLGPIFWLDGNLDCDPLFVDPENGDYHLLENSPCINAGMTAYWHTSNLNFSLTVDEYLGCAPDMGAYEHDDTNLYARFRAESREGCTSLPVEFIDISSGDATGWAWDFDNDQQIDSYEQNPLWIYTDEGQYTVSLTVTNDEGLSSTIIKENYITLHPSRIHNINQDVWYYTIQEAIYCASHYDTLVLNPGTYYERLEIVQKSVCLASQYILTGDESYIYSTIINGEDNYRCLEIMHNYDNTVHLSGLTFTNGNESGGGAIYSAYENLLILDHMRISNCSAINGGAISLFDTNLNMSYSVIFNNTGDNGGAIYAAGDSDLNIQNCTIANNSALEQGSAIYGNNPSDILLINSILWNDPTDEVYCTGFTNYWLTVAYSDILGGEDSFTLESATNLRWLDGNINVDPAFENSAQGNYHLSEDSPCVDAGIAYYSLENIELINLDDDQYINYAPDMGAYEYDNTGMIAYGDIDDSGIVESYDASLLLMYIVGLDPIPEDPLPWEEWRLIRADVNVDGMVMAYDCSLILQYIVGIIEELPVRNNQSFSENLINITSDEKYLYLSADGNVFSLFCQINEAVNLQLHEAEIIQDNCLYSQHENKLALASGTALSGNIIRFPYEVSKSGICSVIFDIYCNGNSEEISYQFPNDAPEATCLKAVYPNPFNPETTISYQLEEEDKVVIDVFNIKGQKVEALLTEYQNAGNHTLTWQPEKLSSGIYYIRFRCDGYQKTVKTLLLK